MGVIKDRKREKEKSIHKALRTISHKNENSL